MKEIVRKTLNTCLNIILLVKKDFEKDGPYINK